MRLTKREHAVVLAATRRCFGEGVTVWLFGSRALDSGRGGDIDLLVETSTPVHQPLRATLALEAAIQSELDDPKVDILLAQPGETLSPIQRIARDTGVRL